MVKNAEGVDEEWSIEGASPNMLFRSGWTNQSFKPGDQVTMVVNPLKRFMTKSLLELVKFLGYVEIFAMRKEIV